ncbi:hypothetical protein STH1185 [Symbiobacterium thermophilum IAM 14863]|uniref:Uncharacterized protein n=1 Tax=Symbiobacterium thermophilum (strain DSM 24528 / JCM 14929 / IAM 14863 / T) TaxID=292459 RepID=Q67Q73_SYMTH|nr:hypothetical protein STH1185 [Symbiobacterium thermophilum IAM 14863]
MALSSIHAAQAGSSIRPTWSNIAFNSAAVAGSIRLARSAPPSFTRREAAAQRAENWPSLAATWGMDSTWYRSQTARDIGTSDLSRALLTMRPLISDATFPGLLPYTRTRWAKGSIRADQVSADPPEPWFQRVGRTQATCRELRPGATRRSRSTGSPARWCCAACSQSTP